MTLYYMEQAAFLPVRQHVSQALITADTERWSVLVQWWATVCDGDPTLNQHGSASPGDVATLVGAEIQVGVEGTKS